MCSCYIYEYLFGLGRGLQLGEKLFERHLALTYEFLLFGHAHQYASLGISRRIAGMDAYTFKIGNVEEKREQAIEALGIVDDHFVTSGGNRCLSLDFDRPDFIFQRVAFRLPVY